VKASDLSKQAMALKVRKVLQGIIRLQNSKLVRQVLATYGQGFSRIYAHSAVRESEQQKFQKLAHFSK